MEFVIKFNRGKEKNENVENERNNEYTNIPFYTIRIKSINNFYET